MKKRGKGKHKRSPSRKAAPATERDLLKGVLKDLDQELKNLRSTRTSLQEELRSVSTKLDDAEQSESSLRDKISTLTKKELELSKKKSIIKDRIVSFDQRIAKVKSIEKNLQQV